MELLLHILPYALPAIHLLGILTAIDALYWSRSSQSALAWGIFLVTFPYLALPIYWIFGRARFRGYRELIDRFVALHQEDLAPLDKEREKLHEHPPTLEPALCKTFERLAQNPFIAGNKVQLLIDGKNVFDAIFAAIERAEKYIVVQFFIIHDDEIGRELRDRLLRKAAAGVKVYVLFDEVGSKNLPASYIQSLRDAGALVHEFGTRQGRGDFFQINFRNHRKIVVVDGKTAFVGGLNVGDEYLGRSKRFGHWRDSHLQVDGPAALQIQWVFAADWLWATRTEAQLDWSGATRVGSQHILTIASGPADVRERCVLFFLESIRCAKKRVWISSPYFVPDDAIIRELQLAALRGVDVRIVLPKNPDHYLVWFASFAFVPEVTSYGVRIFRYTKGFIHQKAVLVDDEMATVGTANLDNRSLRLNFEIMLLVADPAFNAQVATALEKDFADSEEDSFTKFSSLPLSRRLLSKFARLLSPIL
ncbi:MAG: cardiolipin synthase [Deltaproteobacteria bacterium]|nr:cardiolipin synthase [Deltaproteobacteria bacterium]